MNITDNVFMILRTGNGKTYVPVQIVSIKEHTVNVLLPNGSIKAGVYKRNISVLNHNGEKNKGRS